MIIAPALGVRASYYRRLVEQLAAQGLAAAAVDWPGFGASPIRAGWRRRWGYRALVDHVAAVCAAAHARHPRLIALGHSIGGQVVSMLGAQPGLEGVLLVASGTPYWRTWQGALAWRRRAEIELCNAIARVWGHFPGDRVGFAGRESRQLIFEWAHVGRTGSFAVRGFDGDARLAAPGPPIRAIALKGDVFATEDATRRLLDAVTARDVEIERWLDAPHGGDHNRWPSEPGHVVERTLDFIGAL